MQDKSIEKIQESKVSNVTNWSISPITGFLPSEEPLTRLPEFYNMWENTLDHLHELLHSKKLREEVKRWPVFMPSDEYLKSERHWQRAYIVLCFVGQAYVWMNGTDPALKPCPESLPSCLAIPWEIAAKHLNLPTVVTYAHVILYNWRLADPAKGISPDNLRTLHTFTGTRSEEWFYLVSMFCELAAASGIMASTRAVSAAEDNDSSSLINALSEVASSIAKITEFTNMMYKECIPRVFYGEVRPFVSGFTDKKLFPNGLLFEGVSDEAREHGGASAAQSSTIPVFDNLLGISKTEVDKDFMENQKLHMPLPHRKFLSKLAEKSLVRKYVQDKNDSELTSHYNDCVDKLAEFRSEHIKLVTEMIINQAKETTKDMGDLAVKGTGSSNLMSLLEGLRANTLKYKL